jgi:hypothetical protein
LLTASLAFVLAGSTVLPAQQPEPLRPPVPYEDVGACPFEGCVYREWVANDTVAVRKQRTSNAPIVYNVTRGTRVTALTGVVITVRAGRVRFRQPTDLQVYGPPHSAYVPEDGSLHINPGETLYLLTYRGEGSTKAWFNGRIYDQLDGSEFFNALCSFEPNRCNGRIIERPQRVWWVQIQNRRGQIGWTNQPERFDGKDAYG